MAGKVREYLRLPGRGRKRGSFFALAATRATLWSGNDHLLSVYGTGYTEEYKRFYYRDIQAFVMRKTARGAAWISVSALFLVLFTLLALTGTPANPAGAALFWFWGLSLCGLSLIVLIVNLLRGPTCICHLQTAVSREELPSLGRVKYAKKALQILKPLIEEAQGALTREETAALSAELLRRPAQADRSRSSAHGAGTASGYGGAVHEALAYLLLLDGLLSTANIFLRNLAMSAFGTLFTLAFAITLIVALTKQHESGLGRGLRGITWASFLYLLATIMLSYVIAVYEFVRNPAAVGKSQWELFKILSQTSSADNPVLLFTLVFSSIFATTLGIPCLVLARRFRAGRAAASAASPRSAENDAATRPVP